MELANFEQTLNSNDAVVIYFSSPNCEVCKVLKPKIENLLHTRFPKIRFIDIDTATNPELTGQMTVLSVPTVFVYFQGQETCRLSRGFSLSQLEQIIDRPYQLLFS